MPDGAPPFVALAPRQERAHRTQRSLLEATARCLVERGHAGTTTTEVCKLAGVSQGALFKHFPTKADLLAATIAHLFARIVERFAEGIATIADEDDRVAAGIRELWAVFHTPELLAVYGLYAAARTDDDLTRALRPVLRKHRENIRRAARALFPEAAAKNPGFEASVEVVMMAMQGSALMRHVLDDATAPRAELAYLEALARRELSPRRRR